MYGEVTTSEDYAYMDSATVCDFANSVIILLKTLKKPVAFRTEFVIGSANNR